MPKKLTMIEMLDQYDKLDRHMQDHPDATASAASLVTGIERHRVADLLKSGLPDLRRKPISEVLRDRQLAKISLAERDRDLAAAAAAEDSEKVAVKEVLIARNARNSAMDLSVMAAKLRNYAFTRLWPRIEQLDPSALQLDECMRVLWKIGRFEATKVQVEQSALEIERERVGAPTRRQVDVNVHIQEEETFNREDAAADAALLVEGLRVANEAQAPQKALPPATGAGDKGDGHLPN
ncbi:MAG TPA: hypothetical protein VKB92_07895 [Myxococcales bacterium]|nr:hypothetical protein [Myxococcales bacterium]